MNHILSLDKIDEGVVATGGSLTLENKVQSQTGPAEPSHAQVGLSHCRTKKKAWLAPTPRQTSYNLLLRDTVQLVQAWLFSQNW